MTDLEPIAQHVVDQDALVHTLMQRLDTLKQQGAEEHDPVRFRFIESLTHRALEQRESVRERLLQKVQQALDGYEATLVVKPASQSRLNNQSSVVSELSKLRKVLANEADENLVTSTVIGSVIGSGGDNSIVGVVEGSDGGDPAISFAEQLAQQETALLNSDKEHISIRSAAPLPRLKAGIAYQQFQHQQRVDHFIDSAFNETPENPGPLNPEILAIKLLKQINDLSPTYISRYVDYFETLQWLEQEIPPALKQKK
jgi:hypothetical protein